LPDIAEVTIHPFIGRFDGQTGYADEHPWSWDGIR
jgi:hypothetical protein